MDAWMWFGVGALVGAVGMAAVFLRRRGQIQDELATARSRADMLDGRLGENLQEITGLRGDLAEASTERDQAQGKIDSLTEHVGELEGQHAEHVKVLEEASAALTGACEALVRDAPAEDRHELVALAEQYFKPIEELLTTQDTALRKIERRREKLYAQLGADIKAIGHAHTQLATETGRLVTALRRPEVRGRWGEMQLRNTVELAGMTEHCDFTEQPQTDDPTTRDRPDMTVHIPGSGVIVVDSKVALDAYLDSIQPDADREALLHRHAEAVEKHYRSLARKEYWHQFERTPKLVVMFMSLESALVAALEVKPDLYAEAMQRDVLIATPTLLVAILRAIAYGWQQEDIRRNVKEIADTGDKLYQSISRFVDAYVTVGKRIGDAAKSYNKSIGTLETHLLSNARTLKVLNATTEKEIEEVPAIGQEIREVVKPELLSLPDDTE